MLKASGDPGVALAAAAVVSEVTQRAKTPSIWSTVYSQVKEGACKLNPGVIGFAI